MTTFVKVKDRVTGEVFTGSYAPNRLGNLKMNVNGKFYSDKDYNRKFEVLQTINI